MCHVLCTYDSTISEGPFNLFYREFSSQIKAIVPSTTLYVMASWLMESFRSFFSSSTAPSRDPEGASKSDSAQTGQLLEFGMLFAGSIGKEVAKNLWETCKSRPTMENTVLSDSNVFISNRIAKEYGDANSLSEWVRDLDEMMAIACCKAIGDIKSWKERNGGASLTWNAVVSIFNNCDYIVMKDAASKRINDVKSFADLRLYRVGTDEIRKIELISWIKDLFNHHGERDILDNSIIFMAETLDRLAGIATTYGVAIRDIASCILDTRVECEKVMEVGVIRFPRKGNANIKVYRMEIFAFMKSSRVLPIQCDQGGLEIEYNSVEFGVNSAAIDTLHAERAKEKLRDPTTFNF